MKIEFIGDKIDKKLKKLVEKAVTLSLNNLKQNHKKILLSIAFISEEEMRELNNRTRNINSVTDVLSFPNFNIEPFKTIDVNNKENYIQKHIYLGDMAICLKRAEEQAEEYGHNLYEEVVKLVIHSILHLMGFDHIEDSDYELMKQEEEKIASEFYTNKKI